MRSRKLSPRRARRKFLPYMPFTNVFQIHVLNVLFLRWSPSNFTQPFIIIQVHLLSLLDECLLPNGVLVDSHARSSVYYLSYVLTHSPTCHDFYDSAYEKALRAAGKGKGDLITTEIKEGQRYFYAEDYHQQYLAKPGGRQYVVPNPLFIYSIAYIHSHARA